MLEWVVGGRQEGVECVVQTCLELSRSIYTSQLGVREWQSRWRHKILDKN